MLGHLIWNEVGVTSYGDYRNCIHSFELHLYGNYKLTK